MSLINALGIAVPLLIAAALVALAVRRDRRRPRYRIADLVAPGPLPYESPPWPRQPGQAVTHLTPEHDAEQVTGCCRVPLGQVPAGDALSHDQARVTCKGRAPVYPACDGCEPCCGCGGYHPLALPDPDLIYEGLYDEPEPDPSGSKPGSKETS